MRGQLGRTVFIAGFLIAHVALAVSAYFRHAKTWGWQMFANATIYRAEIFESAGGGSGLTPVPDAVLRAALSPRSFDFFRPEAAPKNFHRGRGLLAEAAERIPADLCVRTRGRSSAAFVLRLEHREVSEAAARVDVFRAACR